MSARRGSLTAVGIGIRAPSHTTFEARAEIELAERVFSVVADPFAEYWIRKLNSNTESLGQLYAVGKPRMQTYGEMIERITDAVRRNIRTCAVSYGHPGIFAYPFHESVRILRQEGYEAQMLPGISAQDCFFADLGIDPAVAGCRTYEATEFLVHKRCEDSTTGLMLWQIGSIAQTSYCESNAAWNPDGLAALTERLLEAYRPDHQVFVYEAARLPHCDATVVCVPLRDLPTAAVSVLATLYVPPMNAPRVDAAMARRLGMLR